MPDPTNAYPGTPELYRAAYAMWLENVPTVEIARFCGCSTASVYKWRKLYGWPSRRRSNGGLQPVQPDPTEEEIYGPLTAEIRAGWSHEETVNRAVGRANGAGIKVVRLHPGVRKVAGL